jgi:hypothetical protein
MWALDLQETTKKVTHQEFLKTSGHFEAILAAILENKTDNPELLKPSASGQIQLILKKVRHFLTKCQKPLQLLVRNPNW